MTDPVNVAILSSRLCVTSKGRLTHIAQPGRYRLTMCGAYRDVEYSLEPHGPVLLTHYPPIPEGQRICRRCQAAFDREANHGI